MESLPTCFKASCNDQAVYLVEEDDVYVCKQHYSGRYDNGIPLKSQNDVRDNTKILKQALNVFSCFTKGVNKGELPEDVESLIQKLTKDTEEIQTEFSKVKDPNLYHQFGIIQDNIDNVREFMESEPLFRGFMNNWFWDCMKKYITEYEPNAQNVHQKEGKEEKKCEYNFEPSSMPQPPKSLKGKRIDNYNKVRKSKEKLRVIKPPQLLKSGATYTGQWIGSKRDGQGRQVWKDGSKYEGSWLDDTANGYGILYHADGDIYDGEWLNEKAHGNGKYIHANGATYEGEWADDKQEGYGCETWPDGAKYEGQYKYGKKHGSGVLHFADGSRYEGEFKENEINGTGQYAWVDGKFYEGSWSNNKMQGKGMLRFANGSKYEGDFVQDKREGQGTFEWTDGRKYIGPWKSGKQHGEGTFISSSGETKKGIWEMGKRIRWI